MIYKFLIKKTLIKISGGNWGDDDVDDDDFGDNDVGDNRPGAYDGFPQRCPQFQLHPDFNWHGTGNGTPKSRREDFERSIRRVPLGRSRDPTRPRGRDIDPATYARIQEYETKLSCRYTGD